MSQNRILAILFGVVALLVVVVGGLSVALLVTGDSDSTSSGTTTSGVTGGASQTVNVDDGDIASRLRLASGDPVTMDPHLTGDSLSAEYVVEIFSGLVTISPQLSLELDLAESWEVSDDGLTYTFVLRPDIFFHTGRAVLAEDVKWSVERAASPVPEGATRPSTTALAYLGDIAGVKDSFYGLADSVSGVEVVDDKTIQFTLTQPLPPDLFLSKLTYPTAFVVDRQQIEANPRNWTRRPNGTGPYKLVEWRLGERIVLAANDRFHAGEPSVEQVLYTLSGGSTLTRFENDELDVAFISLADIDRARDPGSDLNPLYSVFPQFTISYIAFNNNVPPFDDTEVRRALALSIDRAKIADVTFNNMLAPATGILPPQLPGHQEEDLSFPFDPDAARAALAASSYGSADALPPIILTEVGGGAEARVDTQAFLEQWRNELGVEVEIRQTDFATFLDDQDAGRLQMFNAGWIMDYPDPEDILDLKFHSASSLNDVGYANADVDDLLDRGRTERDTDLRIGLYQQAERLILDDVAWIPLYFSQSHVVVNAAVTGWFEPPMVIPRLQYIDIER
ncbi:MAG TPA: peptide ABC transporter substrate-binding protein [Dehalococcoidia bacterium]|nr:peptide ABC transporter substrate-binding protein [Dehalococcoidia bacterium]